MKRLPVYKRTTSRFWYSTDRMGYWQGKYRVISIFGVKTEKR